MKILFIPALALAAMLAPLARQPRLSPTVTHDLPVANQAPLDEAPPCETAQESDASKAKAELDRALEEQKRALAEQQKALAEQGKSLAEESRRIGDSVRAQVEQAARQAKEHAGDLGEHIHAQVKAALAQQEEALRQFHLAQNAPVPPKPAAAPTDPTAPVPPAAPAAATKSVYTPLHPNSRAMAVHSSGTLPARALVVSPQQGDPKFVADVEEDLAIMSRILEKEAGRDLRRDGPKEAMGIWINSSGDARGPQAIFLDGYGALFLLQVKFSLVAPPEKKAESKSETPPDTAWERARKEVLGQRDDEGNKDSLKGLISTRFHVNAPFDVSEVHTELYYDAARVEKLKESLFDALKNAANIRHLRAEDSIVVAVSSGGGSGAFAVSVTSVGGGSVGVPLRAELPEPRTWAAAGDRSSTMTIRAKKSDCDAFAQGKLTEEEFRKKVSVNVY